MINSALPCTLAHSAEFRRGFPRRNLKPRKKITPLDRLWRQLSPNRTAEYSDSNHNVHALSGDVNGGAATVGTMSSPLTPLVTDIQWPPWLKMGPAPQKRNGQSTLGLPMHMGGVRQAARCPYGAAEPSWAMVRCISSSHPPILYTACVGFYNLSHVIH